MSELLHLGEYPNIYIDKRCQKELASVMLGYGHRNKFDIWLDQQLRCLNDDGADCLTLYPKRFEPLKDGDCLYSMRHKRQRKNIRIIYTIQRGKIHILLTAFDEKNRSDYVNAITRAESRRKELPFLKG